MSKGITLIETLVVVALIGVMSMAFSGIFVNGLKVYWQEQTETEILSSTQITLDRMINDIKGAKSVSVSNSGYTSGANDVVLEIPAIDSSQNFMYVGNNQVFDYIIYYLSGSTLHRKVVAAAGSSRTSQDKSLDSHISALTYTYKPNIATATKVTVSLSETRTFGKNHRTVNLQAKAKLRNK